MNLTSELFDFLKNATTAYGAVDCVKKTLLGAGFLEINFSSEIKDGGKYFLIKNGTSLVAFKYRKNAKSFMISATHADSPTFKVKSTSRVGSYTRLNVERYGGSIFYSWLDRPLSIAGRVYLRTDAGVECRLLDFSRPVAIIPSLAIHFNREVNSGYKFNPASDMQPIVDFGGKSLEEAIAAELSVNVKDIVSHDLFVYNTDEGKIFADGLICAPRLDDLSSAFAALKAFVDAKENLDTVPVFALFDNEEVGSDTKQGASSVFFSELLLKIGGENFSSMLDSGLMVSADNAHARHPNHPELSDGENAPTLGCGVAIKYNANQKYATDAYSDAIFTLIAERVGKKLQKYSNRPDLPGGSTLGSIASTKLPVSTIDIGIPQLAMHSANETLHSKDLSDMYEILKEFYSVTLLQNGDKTEIK